MPLDEWQEQVFETAMGERSDGRWASKYVGLSAPRQNGKSQLIVARALAGVLLFGEKMVIISAHETDTAREVWKRLIDVIEDNPTLEKRLSGRMDAINREFVSFGTGSERQTIKLKARGEKGVRGFSADCLLLDEGQILGKRAWGSINPTMSAMPNPQLWLFGTPPTETDDPFAFARVRDNAQSHKARHCWLEWSADEGDDIDDPETWAKANPAYGVRISYEACADDRAAMDDQQFCVERLGMWGATEARHVIPLEAWTAAGDTASLAVDRLALGVEVGPDMAWASVSLAGRRADGAWHIELDQHMEGSAWVVPYVKALQAANPNIRAVVADKGSPSKTLVDAFEAEGVAVTYPTVNDLGAACARLFEGVITGAVHHLRQPQVNAALAAAGKRALGDTGMWVWSRKTAAADITPIQAATLALWGAQSENVAQAKQPSPVFAF
jgi:phage terminase large subunit-like protein